jgi:putative PIG3 family NAD(P)H quinone oxidoreductase
MRAVVISRPGGPEVLELRQVPSPPLGPGDVRVQVLSTAVNRADLLQRMGLYPAPPEAPPDIPGLEFAGRVIEVGRDAARADGGGHAIGERVFGLVGGGAYAEEVVLPGRAAVRIPDSLGDDEAAAVPEAFITAWDALVTQGELEAGESLLVHAVGSGVGAAAVQLGRVRGARVLGTARSDDKLAKAQALGLDVGVRPDEGLFAARVREATAGRGVDVVLDLVGGAYVAEELACVAERGRILVVGLTAGSRAELDLGLLLRRRVRLQGTVLRSRALEEKLVVMQTFARHVVPLLAAGRVRPIVDRVLPLEAAAEAHALVGSNTAFGKVVLRVAAPGPAQG